LKNDLPSYQAKMKDVGFQKGIWIDLVKIPFNSLQLREHEEYLRQKADQAQYQLAPIRSRPRSNGRNRSVTQPTLSFGDAPEEQPNFVANNQPQNPILHQNRRFQQVYPQLAPNPSTAGTTMGAMIVNHHGTVIQNETTNAAYSPTPHIPMVQFAPGTSGGRGGGRSGNGAGRSGGRTKDRPQGQGQFSTTWAWQSNTSLATIFSNVGPRVPPREDPNLEILHQTHQPNPQQRLATNDDSNDDHQWQQINTRLDHQQDLQMENIQAQRNSQRQIDLLIQLLTLTQQQSPALNPFPATQRAQHTQVAHSQPEHTSHQAIFHDTPMDTSDGSKKRSFNMTTTIRDDRQSISQLKDDADTMEEDTDPSHNRAYPHPEANLPPLSTPNMMEYEEQFSPTPVSRSSLQVQFEQEVDTPQRSPDTTVTILTTPDTSPRRPGLPGDGQDG
jgi:hypothetical protein